MEEKTWKGQPLSLVQVVTQQHGTKVSSLKLEQTVVGFSEWFEAETNRRVPKTIGEACSLEETKAILGKLSTKEVTYRYKSL